MTMTNYPKDREYESKHPSRCPVVTATASSNGVRVCGLPLVDDFCSRHGLAEKPLDVAMQNESDTLIDFYCPACGESSRVHWPALAPGDSTVTCPECGTQWMVRVEFVEVEP